MAWNEVNITFEPVTVTNRKRIAAVNSTVTSANVSVQTTLGNLMLWEDGDAMAFEDGSSMEWEN